MKESRVPDLNELAFTGRNKAYGAYMLRKSYPRYMAISVLSGVMITVLTVMIPFVVFYFSPEPFPDAEILTDVQYYSFLPPPDEDLTRLPGSAPKLPEIQKTPVVSDSIKEEDLRPVQTPIEEENQEPADTTGKKPGNALNGDGSGDAAGLVAVVDVLPRYPGGDEARLWFLRRNIRYPEAAIKSSVQGVVVLLFIIETDGSISNIEVNKAIGGGCDEEAIRVVRMMPKWEPARRAGKPVRVVVRMPIIFRFPGK